MRPSTPRLASFLALPVLTALLLCFAPPALSDDEPPAPDFDRVDHTKPGMALDLCEAFGSEAEIRKIAAGLKADTRLATLRAIDAWIEKEFRYDKDAAYSWRTFERMRDDGTYGGCSDHSVIFGSLARAAGIPTVYVESADCDWIRKFVKGPEPSVWSGHCFLEVHLDGAWALLDATQMILYRDYKPTMRILPGNRYSYDKGHDPFTLVKSIRWELWKKKARAYFKDFDLTKLPVAGGQALRAGAGSSLELDRSGILTRISLAEHHDAVNAHAEALGWRVTLGHSGFVERIPARSRGGCILMLAAEKKPLLASAALKQAYAADHARFVEQLARYASGVFGRTMADGTRLFTVWGTTEANLLAALKSWKPIRPSLVRGANLPKKVFIAAHPPYWQWLSARCEKLGMARQDVRSFNYRFDLELPRVKGHTLVITWVGDVLVLPERYHGEFLPTERARVEKLLVEHAHGRIDKTLKDGTRVVLLYARDEAAMRAAAAALTLAPAKPTKAPTKESK